MLVCRGKEDGLLKNSKEHPTDHKQMSQQIDTDVKKKGKLTKIKGWFHKKIQ